MSIDPLVLARQRALLHGEPRVRAILAKRPRRAGPKMTRTLCPRCREHYLAQKNVSGVCAYCWIGMSRAQRAAFDAGSWEPRRRRKQRKADADTIARAAARLASKGIHLEAA